MRARWTVFTTVSLALSGVLGSVAGYWQSKDARTMLTELERDIRVEAQQARSTLEEGLRRDLDRLERDMQHKANIDGLASQLARIELRLDRLESMIFRGRPDQ
jgi:ubiquinone biosynthesis protein UbiJ